MVADMRANQKARPFIGGLKRSEHIKKVFYRPCARHMPAACDPIDARWVSI